MGKAFAMKTKIAIVKNLLPQILIFMSFQNASGIDLLIKTNVGFIKGLQATDGNYSMFLGIPYAKVDLHNPFGPAIPHVVFNEIFEAVDDSVKCPQFNTNLNTGIGTLDCLTINIHVPNSDSSKTLLPVMVFIYGGRFSIGYGGKYDYGPKFLVEHDVILVTFNHRLGVYGFMCLGTPEIPGNQGLKDQVLALRWIKANIHHFGGDPNKVTLFGQSSGARSIDYHLMANDENLFSKVIMQSGNSLSSPQAAKVNTKLPISLAKKLGFDTDDFRKAVKFLITVNPKLLVSAAYDVVGPIFEVCIENKINGVEGYVSDYTINRKIPKVKTTPILIGFNEHETYFYYASKDDSYYKETNIFQEFLRHYFKLGEEEVANLANLIRKFYIGDEELNIETKQKIADFASDFTYIHPIHRGITQYLLNGATKIYYYMFCYDGDRNVLKQDYNFTIPGAVHGDEIGYLFNLQKFKTAPNTADQIMIDRMTTMWTNFAKYGDPTPETSMLLPVKWKPIEESNWYYYKIDSEVSLQRRPFHRRMAFMDLLFKMNECCQRGIKN